MMTSKGAPVRSMFEHAVVIGGSLAGLMAARVLSDFFSKVTVLERDLLPARPRLRRGAPQARHAHTLMPFGLAILERLFPGLVAELLAQGAVPVEAGAGVAIFEAGAWTRPPSRPGEVSVYCSRPMLETALYQRVAAHPGVEILEGYESSGLISSQEGGCVGGVQIRQRETQEHASALPASLIVDASGRGSHAPQWLARLGYLPPEEWTINAFTGYATRIYQPPSGYDPGWKALYIQPTPPAGTRGGIIVPVEGDRWYVTLIGIARDYPPTDERGFMRFARSLPGAKLYEAIRVASPLGKPSGWRLTTNQVRRYESLPRYLEGFLVIGDAAFALNPLYAQGMTAAAVGAQTLGRCLQAQSRKENPDDFSGLSASFQEQLRRDVSRFWQIATQHDWGWDATEIEDNELELLRFARTADFNS